ncbi:MAG: hypothetical protein PHE56_05330, partial [Bacteroidales bacterium]|nr:hypothetical protein [Bacteroidales bacterium]
MKFYNAFLVLLTVMIMFSCSNTPTEQVNDNGAVKCKNNEILLTELEGFFNFLRKEDYEKCIAFFSDSLLRNPGKEKIIEGLKERNSQFGLGDSIQVYYIRKNAQADSYTCFVRSFYSEGTQSLSYDKISVDILENLVKISSLESSAMPYCDAAMANDTLSEINQFLNLVYQTLTNKGIDEA